MGNGVKKLRRARVGVLSVHPAPYRDETFAEIHRRGNVDINVLFYFGFDRGHVGWNYEHPVFPCSMLGGGISFGRKDRLMVGLIPYLLHNRFDALLIPGYARVNSLVTIMYAIATGTPYILFVDSTPQLDSRINRSAFKQRIVRCIFQKTSAFWVPGAASSLYLRDLDIDVKKIFQGAYCFDSFALAAQVDVERLQREQIRDSLSITNDTFVFLSVANMTKNRCFDLLIKAFTKIKVGAKVHLVMIGNRPERSTIESLLDDGGREGITIVDSAEFARLPSYYAIADAYVHAGHEPFSTATELGAISGLPIISTSGVGYIRDLIDRGGEPFIVDPYDLEALTSIMRLVVTDKDRSLESGRRSRHAALQRNSRWAAEEFEKAVAIAIRC